MNTESENMLDGSRSAALGEVPMNTELAEALIPGTDVDVLQRYATLTERARTHRFGLIEPEYVVLDTETTGFSPEQDALIEIAAAIVSGPDIRARFSTFVNPEKPIPPFISELTGITDKDVENAPLAHEAVQALAEFVGERRVIAHNAAFDQGFIQAHAGTSSLASKDPWIDTVELARIALPRIKSHNLELLSTAFCPDEPSSHRAIDDVEALCRVWRVLLVALSDLPPGLPYFISQLCEGTPWGARNVFKMIALDQAQTSGKTEAKDLHFSLVNARNERIRSLRKQEKIDAQELDGGVLTLEELDYDEIKAAYTSEGLAGAMYPYYEPRAEQAEMACEVARAFNTSTHRAIEAGTGVGKSMGYLLPLALFAKRNRVICGVATKTNALLDQLVYQELPRLNRALIAQGGAAAQSGQSTQGHPSAQSGQGTQGGFNVQGGSNTQCERGIEYVALKGYEHYPCLRKLMRYAAQDHHPTSSAPMVLVGQVLAYVSQSSMGDMDPLPLRWYEVSRFDVCASADDCLRNKCHYYAGCLLHGARRHADHADIVVTNHALLFCDHLFEGSILPSIRHWVIDEAHSAESEARRQITVQIEARGLIEVLAQLSGSDGALAYLKNRAEKLSGSLMICGLIDHAHDNAQAIESVADSFFSYVKDLAELAEPSSYDQVELWIHPGIRAGGPWGNVYMTGYSLAKRLETLIKACQDVVSACAAYDELLEEQSDLTGLTMRLREALDALTLILDGTNEDYVYYAELDRRATVTSDKLVAAIVDVGATLAQSFYPELNSVIFTSATIATGTGLSAGAYSDPWMDTARSTNVAMNEDPNTEEDFAYFMRGVGLDRIPFEMRRTLLLDSSYDFERNMAVYLPNDLPEPTASTYFEALEELLFEAHVALGGSVLTLFTNRREMEGLYGKLNSRLAEKGLSLKCQFRSISAKRLRDEFVENESLSLFALRSFWEGFDAPGATLRCVIIPKLPFSRPKDPLQQERARRESGAWKRYVLPEAVIDLKQAAGRLIRSSTDEGCLILADARLRTKWYGANFLAALPSQRHYRLSTQEIAEEMRRLR